MVENRNHNDNDKFKEFISRLDRISTQNLELDLTRREFDTVFEKMSEKEKIYSMLSQSDDIIIQWHQEEFKSKKLEDFTYDLWKEKLTEALGRTITLKDFFEKKQYKNESAVDYFKAMERYGKQLKFKEDIILEITKKGLIKNISEIRLAICGEKKLTKVLYDKIREADIIGNELYLAKIRRKERKYQNDKGHFNKDYAKKLETPKKGLNLIETDEVLNKDNYFYILGKKTSVYLILVRKKIIYLKR